MMRPNMVRRLLAVVVVAIFTIAALIFAVAVITAPHSHAMPGQCGSGYTPWGGGGFCDGDVWPDGSVLHHENVCVLGFCGGNTFRACLTPDGRVPTDNDPSTPC